VRAVLCAVCLALIAAPAALPAKKVKRKKPTCPQVEAAVEQTVAELRPQYGAVSGGADEVCLTISKFTKQGAGTIGRRDSSPTCMVTVCCPATDCLHTNWMWDEMLTRNRKGKLVTEILNFRCRRFQVLNGAQGTPQPAC
jgi:hypothetical protein